MKRETKTIIIGILITIAVLLGVLFIIYVLTSNKSNANIKTKTNYQNSNYINNESKNNNIQKQESTNNSNNPTNNNSNANTNPNINTSKENIVTIYIFRGEGCPHCEHAIEYFKENVKNKNIQVKAYETWYNDNNSKLMNFVADKLKADVTGVPFIVIGDYYKVGFGDGEELLKEATKRVKDKDFKNVVETVLEEHKDLKVENENIK